MSLGAFHLATNQDPVSTSNYQLGGGGTGKGAVACDLRVLLFPSLH